MPRDVTLSLVLCGLALLGCPLVAQEKEEPAAPTVDYRKVLEAGPMGTSAENLTRFGEQIQPANDQPILPYENLLRDISFELLEDGTLKISHWSVYRINTRPGLDEAGVYSSQWSPFHSDRPEIKIRVVTRRGELETDSSTAQVHRPMSEDGLVLSDHQMMQLPIAGLRVGCLVETLETSIRKPLMGKTHFSALALIQQAGNRQLRVRVTHRPGDGLTHQVKDIAIDPVIQEGDNGVVTAIYDVWDLKGLADYYEEGIGPNALLTPMFVIAKSEAWDSVAQWYGQQVDQAIMESDQAIKRFTQPLLDRRGEMSDLELMQACTEQVRNNVRYTSLAFGDGRILPAAPSSVVTRRFGDCKDQSTLLVGMLRECGFDARVALLATGPGTDVLDELPCINQFNHVVVWIDSTDDEKDSLWVDPVANYFPVGSLPDSSQGRKALVCRDGESQFVKTPASLPGERHTRIEHTFAFDLNGKGTIQYRHTGHGDDAGVNWSQFADLSNREWVEVFGGAVASLYPLAQVVRLQVSDRELTGDQLFDVIARSQPVQVAGHIGFSPEINSHRLRITTGGADAVGDLPWPLKIKAAMVESNPDAASDIDPRQRDFVFETATSIEKVYRVWYPSSLAIEQIPQSWVKRLGPVTISVKYRDYSSEQLLPKHRSFQTSDLREMIPAAFKPADAPLLGADLVPLDEQIDDMKLLAVTYSVSAVPGTISAPQVNEYRDELMNMVLGGKLLTEFWFHWKSTHRFADRPAESMRLVKEDAKRYPHDFAPWERRAAIYPQVGLHDEAEQYFVEAEKRLAGLSVGDSYRPWFLSVMDHRRFDSPQREMLADLPLAETYPSAFFESHLTLLRTDPQGSLSRDQQLHEQLIDRLDQLQQQIETEIDPQVLSNDEFHLGRLDSLRRARIQSLLALKRDDEIPADRGLINEDSLLHRFGDVAYLLVHDIPPPQRILEIPGLPSRTKFEMFAESHWMTFLSLGRDDLARKYRQLLNENVRSSLPDLAEDFDESAFRLDPGSPESIARTVLLAMLRGDNRSLRGLCLNPNAPSLAADQTKGPHPGVKDWMLDQPWLSNDRALVAIAASVPADVQSFGENELLQIVRLDGLNGLTMRVGLIREAVGEPYRVIHPDDQNEMARPLLNMLDKGLFADVEQILAEFHHVPEEEFATYDPAAMPVPHMFWNRVASHDNESLRLMCQILDSFGSASNRSIEALQQALTEDRWSGHQVELRRSLYAHYRDLDPRTAFDHLLWLNEKFPGNMLLAMELIDVGPKAEQDTKRPLQRDQWSAIVSQTLDQLDSDLFVDSQRADYEYATGNIDQYFREIARLIQQFPGTDTRFLQNQFLWRSILQNARPTTLHQRLALCQSLLESDVANQVHTAVCAIAASGRMSDVTDAITQIERSDEIDSGSMSLARGLFAQTFGDDEVAEKYFQLVLQSKDCDDCNAIAAERLKTLESQ